MNYNDVKSRFKSTIDGTVKGRYTLADGEVVEVELTEEDIDVAWSSKIWRSAGVIKTKRQADKGGIKAVIRQAVDKGIIEQADAFGYVMDGISEEKLAEIKEQLPTVEKTATPTDEDGDDGARQVMVQKGGQR